MARPYASTCTQRPGCQCGSARCRYLQNQRDKEKTEIINAVDPLMAIRQDANIANTSITPPGDEPKN
jgi:hypothetical protein